jgi:hypothetical protein
MKSVTTILTAIALSTCILGCTAISLERRTVNQTMSSTDLRYQMVMENLATSAANGGALPSFGIISDGMTTVSDSAKFDASTAWSAKATQFKEALSAGVSRQPALQWTVDPTKDPNYIRAVHAACLAAIYGLPDPESDDQKLLVMFDVWDKLSAIEPGWLHVSCGNDARHRACYASHYCNACVWVGPEGLRGLSEFTLVLLDIATVDVASMQPVANFSISKTEKLLKANSDKSSVFNGYQGVTFSSPISSVSCKGDEQVITFSSKPSLILKGENNKITLAKLCPSNPTSDALAAPSGESILPNTSVPRSINMPSLETLDNNNSFHEKLNEYKNQEQRFR